jgi:integrase
MIAEWLTNGRRLPTSESGSGSDLSINEMLLSYLGHVDAYYVKNDKPTVEPGNIRLAIRPLRQLYGHTAGRDFGPLALKAVRKAMVDGGLCRSEINRRVGRIVRAFKWAVSEEMVPPSVHQALQTVPGLRRGRADVRESEPVKPVPDAFVDAIEPFVSKRIWAMVELQRLSGMRPGEVCIMRTCDLDTSGRVWAYTPESHKTEHHGRERRIYLGPQAQEVLRPWLRTSLTAYLFSPAEAEADRHAELRERRKTPVQPSQRNRRSRRPRKTPGERYTPDSYRRAIESAIKAANRGAERKEAPVPHWHPHQLRHNAATRLRKECGLDAARAVLGHSSPRVTEVYAERDSAVASEAMAKLG